MPYLALIAHDGKKYEMVARVQRREVFARESLVVTHLLKVCDTHNIPLATNLATADLILDHLVLEANAHGY